MARGIDDPDGSSAGLDPAMLDPDAFQAVYEAIDNGPGTTLNLWRADGALLARTTRLSQIVGGTFAASENHGRPVPSREAEPFRSAALTGGARRYAREAPPGPLPMTITS